jgi:hypothetical protein
MVCLRKRKAIYLCVALPACAFWIPISFIGMIFVFGIFGLVSIASLLRCIVALPVESRFARNYYRVTITGGLVLMSAFLLLSLSERAHYTSLIVSGLALLLVGALVLVELESARSARPSQE